jgi:hypothetical protein
VNFLAHADVARRSSGDDPAFVLGAVLPDLLPMAGVRLDRGDVAPEVAAGWAEHHRADAAFHAHPAFLAGVGALRADLRSTSLGTGPRRAAAHVGWELLLDDEVAGSASLVAVFRSALALGRSVTREPAWHGLLDRFSAIQPAGPAGGDVLAERVRRACSRRARLAFGPEHLDELAVVLERHRAAVASVAPGLLDDVAQAGSIP